MAQFKDFIPENVALPGTRRIGIYKDNGIRAGFIPLGNLVPKSKGEKLYSFGALSDVHITQNTAIKDFQNALTYLNNDIDVDFICICGDLTNNGTADELEQYETIVNTYASGTPVYAIAGNHEKHDTQPTLLEQYTGKPLYYSFEYGNDVFLMCGCYSDSDVFTQDSLQWLYETLEANRNKRCFIFEHVMPFGDCGNPGALYPFDLLSGTDGKVFQSLLQHYKNVVFFHGHSHTKFYLQEIDSKANYSYALKYRSVHIPSLAVPKDIVDGEISKIYADSEGYVVDVYENGIHLRGRDFVKEEFLPIASYWLDTTLQTILAGTFTDSTGTITT